ncbi:hypothetical protein IAT40_007751 [Kwoniella sp. CBS 6097]
MATFQSLTDEFLKQLGTYLLPIGTPDQLKVPSFTPHWLNSPEHVFDRRPRYKDYCSLRSVSYRLGYLLKPVQDDLMIEVESKEYWWRLVNDASDDILQRIVRLRLNFSLDADDDPSTESERYWSSFTSFLLKLPNLVELYFTTTPFCYHPGIAQTFPLSEPDLSGATKLVSFANEVKCRVCAENLSNALSISRAPIKHLKTTSDDSTSRDDMIEPYDIYLYANGLETFYLKSEGLDTSEEPFLALPQTCPGLKQLILTAHQFEEPHELLPKAYVACTRHGETWRYDVSGDGIRTDLHTYADSVGLLTNLEVFDPSFFITFPNMLDDFPAIPSDILSSTDETHVPRPDDFGFGSTQTEKMKAFMEAYKATIDEALIAATRVMKSHVPSLKEMTWWQQDVDDDDDGDSANEGPAATSPSSETSHASLYLRYACQILPDRLASGEWEVKVDGPIRLSEQMSRNSDGYWMPEVEPVSNEQARALDWTQ